MSSGSYFPQPVRRVDIPASKAGGAGIDIGAIIGTLAGDGVGGGALMAIIGALRSMMVK